jgi:hypothetical protein
MKIKLVVAISALAAIPAPAHAQQGGPQPIIPKPTKADVQNVGLTITTLRTRVCTSDRFGFEHFSVPNSTKQKGKSIAESSLVRQVDSPWRIPHSSPYSPPMRRRCRSTAMRSSAAVTVGPSLMRSAYWRMSGAAGNTNANVRPSRSQKRWCCFGPGIRRQIVGVGENFFLSPLF